MADASTIIVPQIGLTNLLVYALNTASALKLRLIATAAYDDTLVIGGVSASEVSGNGYPAGGATANYTSTAYDATDGRSEGILSAQFTASGGSITYRQAVLTLNTFEEYPQLIYQWAVDEVIADGNTSTINLKLNLGPQGATVDVVDT